MKGKFLGLLPDSRVNQEEEDGHCCAAFIDSLRKRGMVKDFVMLV